MLFLFWLKACADHLCSSWLMHGDNDESAVRSEEVEITLEETCGNRNGDISPSLDTSGNDLVVVVYILFEF